jgi:catechol-2,3-dioxygenase
MIPKIIQFLHSAILVSDLTRAEHFYGTILGLTKVNRKLKYPGAWYQIGNHQIHLIFHNNFTGFTPNQETWGRNPHLALAVENLQQAKEHLQAHNCPVQMSASGRAALFTKDPDGNIIEITEIPNL